MIRPLSQKSEGELDLLKYVIELIEFRGALRQGKKDANWAEANSSHRIIYLIDTNIAYLYFQPLVEAKLTRALKSIPSRTDGWIAVITSQLVFDGLLPGRGEYPIFMDPLHLNGEFSKKILDIRDDYKRVANSLKEETFRQLIAETRRISEEIEKNHSVDTLKRILEVGFRKLFDKYKIGEIAAPWLLRDLIHRKDLLRPLSLGPFLHGCDIEAFDDDKAEAWRELIRRQYSDEEYRRLTKNIERDAKCLARLQLINDHLRKRGAGVRYVLITANRATLEAVRLRKDIQNADDPGPLARDILQYIPLGNIRDLNNSVSTAKGTAAMERAIDVLFAVDELDPKDRDKRMDELLTLSRLLRNRLDVLRREEGDMAKRKVKEVNALVHHFFDTSMEEALTETRTQVKSRWDKLLRTAVDLNLHEVLSHYSRWFGDLLDALDSMDADTRRRIGGSYESVHLEQAAHLTRTHVYVVINSSLSSNLENAREWSRSALGICLDYGECHKQIAKRVIRTLRAVANGDVNDLRKRLSKLCFEKSAVETDVTLAGAAVALQCGHWNVAAELARQSYLDETSSKNMQSELRRARAWLIKAIAFRTSFMRSESSITEWTGIIQINDELDKAAVILYDYDRPQEVAIVYAEKAWAGVLKLFLSDDPSDIPAICEDVRRDASSCMDLVAQSQKSICVDIVGSDVVEVALARSAAALVFACLCQLVDDPVITTSIQTMALSAGDALRGRQGKLDGGDARQGVWQLLGEISQLISTTDLGKEFKLPIEIKYKLEHLHSSKALHFPREARFLVNAIESLSIAG